MCLNVNIVIPDDDFKSNPIVNTIVIIVLEAKCFMFYTYLFVYIYS